MFLDMKNDKKISWGAAKCPERLRPLGVFEYLHQPLEGPLQFW